MRDTIISCLGLRDPAIVVASFNRPNIALTVRHKALIGSGGGGSDQDVLEVRVGAGPRASLHAK